MIGVFLGLGAALAWGSADFWGGLAARRNHPLQVLVTVSLSGTLLFGLLAAVVDDSLPNVGAVGWASLAGACSAVGLAALYRGLAVGHAAEVAPVAAVASVVLPVAIGWWTAGRPPVMQILGFGAALAGVWLVSRFFRQAESTRQQGLAMACLAGFAFGGFFVALAQVESGPIFAPLAVAKGVGLIVALGVALAKRLSPWTTDRPVVPALVGLVDAGGTVFYLLATRYARLDVAAVLSSLYAAVTVTLAFWVLAQRPTATQWLGVALCLIAVALIAA